MSELPAYVIAQVLGGLAGSGVLYIIAMGKAGFDLAGGFASNGYGAHSPGGYSLAACLTAEVVLTFMFLMIILGATDTRAPKGFAPIAIPRVDAHSSHRDSSNEPVRESGAQHRSGSIRWRIGARNSCGCSGWRRS